MSTSTNTQEMTSALTAVLLVLAKFLGEKRFRFYLLPSTTVSGWVGGVLIDDKTSLEMADFILVISFCCLG